MICRLPTYGFSLYDTKKRSFTKMKRQSTITDKYEFLHISYLREITNNIENNRRTDYSTSGYDMRYNCSDDENINISDLMVSIKYNFYLYALLEKLKDKNISELEKIELIERHKQDNMNSPIVTDMTAGDLYKDWNYEFYTISH